MNENKSIPSIKLYKEEAISFGTFLGGPLVAGYFFAENFKALRQPEKVRPTWIITIVSTILIFSILFLIPEDSKLSSRIIPLIYTGIAYAIFNRMQKNYVSRLIEAGVTPHGWGRVIGVSLIGLVITFVMILVPLFAYESTRKPVTKSYGGFVKHEIEYYESSIEEWEVDRIADCLRQADFFVPPDSKFVHVSKTRSTYEIYLSILPGTQDNLVIMSWLTDLRDQMDSLLPNNEIEFLLMDESGVVATIE